MFSKYDFMPKKPAGRILVLGAVTVLILFGTHTNISSLAAFAISALVILFDKTGFRLVLMTYLTLMAHIFRISVTGMSYFTLLMFIYIGVKLYEEKTIQWIAIFFIVYVLIVQLCRSHIAISDDLKLFSNILFIGYSLGETWLYSDKQKETLCLTYIMAILISSVMRFFDSPFFRISDFTESLNTIGAGTENELVRFSGLYQDPNYYTVNLIIGLCMIIILYYKRSIHPIFCALLAGALVYFGTLTYSKSFLLMLLIPLLVFMYANHRVGRNDIQIISLVVLVMAVVLVLQINPDYITGMQQRMDDGNSLTTGRTDLWMEYLDYIYQHPDVMLFGSGIGLENLLFKAPHNTYVDILFHLGLVGGFLLIVSIINSGRTYCKNIQLNLLNRSVWISILITYFFLSQLHGYEFTIHFMLGFMVLYQWDMEKSTETRSTVICQPLLPDLNNERIKTLLPMENEK